MADTNRNISQADMQNNNEQTIMTVRFRRPRQSRTEEELIFPPTVYTDAKYTEGILIPAARSIDNDNDSNVEEAVHDDSDTEEVAVQIPENYFRHYDNDTRDGNDNLLPTLSQNEVATWNHNIAAFSAAKRRFPMQIARLLGTITLYFKGGTQSKTTLYQLSEKYCKKNDSAAKNPNRDDSNFTRTFSKKQAMNEARLEMEIEEDLDETTLPLEIQGQLKRRTEEIFHFWKNIRESVPIQECWSRKYGS